LKRAFRNQARGGLQSVTSFGRRYDCNLPEGRMRIVSQADFSLLAVVGSSRGGVNDCNLPKVVPAAGGRHRQAVKIDDLGHVTGRLSQPGFSLVAVVDAARAVLRLQPA
jgi:hypothetical protein